MANQPHTIFLIGFSRPDVTADVVVVQAQFTGPDPFTGEISSSNREIRLSDSQLGPKWDEDDILFWIADSYPMVGVQWMEREVPVVVETPAEQPPVVEPVVEPAVEPEPVVEAPAEPVVEP